MDKQRKWHLFLILAVIGLTIYNILPTLFYYTKPLKQPVSESVAKEISLDIVKRVNNLEAEAHDWLASFCDLIHAKPTAIATDSLNPQLISLRFVKAEDAARFRAILPRAGSLIPFAPSQLSLVNQNIEENPKTVLVQRKIGVRLDPDLFAFAPTTSPLYQKNIRNRAAQVAAALAGSSDSATMIDSIEKTGFTSHPEWLFALAAQINALEEIREGSPFYTRLAASFTQGPFADRSQTVEKLISSFDQARDLLKTEKGKAAEEDRQILEKKELSLAAAEKTIKKHLSLFSAGQEPLTLEQAELLLQSADQLDIGGRHPFFSHVFIDWEHDKIVLKLHNDIAKLKHNDTVEQLLINEIAKATRHCNETFTSGEQGYAISLHTAPNVSGLLNLKLETIASRMTHQISSYLRANWNPRHPDLSPENFPIVDFEAYQVLSPEQKALCLIAYAPAATEGANPFASRNNSIYFLAKGLNRISEKMEKFPDSELTKTFRSDFQALHRLLVDFGFVPYAGATVPFAQDLASDVVYENRDYFVPLLAATREDFHVKGSQKAAVLELSNQEQRILTENKIETRIHEDLQKWKDEYRSASVSLDPALRFDAPKPTRSVFWSNIALTLRKMVRGDDRKIIRWGLDLSGGKTVQIELRDSNNRPVKEEADLKQGINELYNRVNKMGVSEVSIRQVGHQITLDFPGSQALSASELVRASTLYFHIVNEKFAPYNSSLGDSVNLFLQQVWNEAQVTNRKDPQSLNEIAYKHLYGDDASKTQPRSEAARTLLDSGLSLQSPNDPSMSNLLNDAVSKIALMRGADSAQWHGQSHPLMIVFRNFALEGSSLDNVHSSYDPSRGNYLSFDIRGASLNREGQKVNPRDDLHAWSSRFSKTKIAGTSQEAYSRGQGWRMAVILNNTVISSPTLNEALRDSAMISGSFSQREVNQLASDLKAGSLTFTPHILSEKNVSPELGKSDRDKGIFATFVALLLVIGSMVAYYRFGGLVASVAVILNILIMWAALQNLGATLSLAGIAGLILTVGMAVDANVLVFERIKEEFALTKRLSSAIAAGYKKAFTAIVDSNVTTIIAALILLNFDAGPIKAFAVTLIIGIASSMFTALFMTRFYFTGWIQNPKNKTLSMANWFKETAFPFLRYAKGAFAISVVIIAIGTFVVAQQRTTIFGMDFTGGYSLHLELEQTKGVNYASQVDAAFRNKGLSPQDFQIRELNPSNQLRVLFSTSLEQPGKPFAGMPLETDAKEVSFTYEKNPRIQWAVDAIEASGLHLSPLSKGELHANWTAMSGQMSESMRNNALIGLFIAFVSIFIYIAARFEYKFAAAASLCLLHDVLITIGSIGLLHFFGVPIQIDLNTVAALMTIVGYSLNDTIIIFDRIREDIHLGRQKNLEMTINHALNATLSRTTITSGTTLLVLLALVFLGGSSIFSFALVMTIGVVFGTLSSWFIASPLMLYFHKKETAQNLQEAN